jgi:hypothetical protein
VTSSIVISRESSSVPSPSPTIPSSPPIESQFPPPVRLSATLTTESTGSLPAVRLGAPCPVGEHWPIWCVALAVQLVCAVKQSINSVPRVLAAVSGFLTGHTWAATMSWTTVRCWLMRLGLYALLRPLPRGDDWAFLIGHAIQIGTLKCFAAVGVRLSEWPDRCLRHDDVCLVALMTMQHSTAVTVERALEGAGQRTGPPRLIVSDH